MAKTNDTDTDLEARRRAFRRWLEAHGNANQVAKQAEISVSAIYNFLNGPSRSLSTDVLTKLAAATGSTVESILTGGQTKAYVPILFRVGAGGSMFIVQDEILTTTRPPGVSVEAVSAGLVDGGGLHPIPDGWCVFFRDDPSPPETLVGKLATVRYEGGGARPAVRTIRRGSAAGLFTLQALSGALTEDVAIVAAHEIISFAATEVSHQ